MLKEFRPEDFFEGSFADHRIIKENINFENKYIKLNIEGALSEDEDEKQKVIT